MTRCFVMKKDRPYVGKFWNIYMKSGSKREIYCKLFHGMKLSESLLEGLVTPTCLSLCDMVSKSCKLKITRFNDPFFCALSNKDQEPKVYPDSKQKWYKNTVAVIISFIHNVTAFMYVFHFSAFYSFFYLYHISQYIRCKCVCLTFKSALPFSIHTYL